MPTEEFTLTESWIYDKHPTLCKYCVIESSVTDTGIEFYGKFIFKFKWKLDDKPQNGYCHTESDTFEGLLLAVDEHLNTFEWVLVDWF